MIFFRKIHLWLSIPFGIIFSITCLTGALLVFEKEITALVRPEQAGTETVQQTAPQARESHGQDAEARSGEGRHGEARAAEGRTEGRNREAGAVEGMAGAHGREAVEGKSEVHGSGAATAGRKSSRLPFFQTVFKLHRWLMDAPASRGESSVGKIVVGISTLLMVFVLLSGIIIWVPKTLVQLKNRLTVSVNKGWPRFMHDSHVSLGIFAAVFLLIMALTGLTWSFSWYREGFVAVFDGIVGADQMRHFIFKLHTGSWGGIITRIIYFLSAIIGAFLPWTGYYIWLKKRGARKS